MPRPAEAARGCHTDLFGRIVACAANFRKRIKAGKHALGQSDLKGDEFCPVKLYPLLLRLLHNIGKPATEFLSCGLTHALENIPRTQPVGTVGKRSAVIDRLHFLHFESHEPAPHGVGLCGKQCQRHENGLHGGVEIVTKPLCKFCRRVQVTGISCGGGPQRHQIRIVLAQPLRAEQKGEILSGCSCEAEQAPGERLHTLLRTPAVALERNLKVSLISDKETVRVLSTHFCSAFAVIEHPRETARRGFSDISLSLGHSDRP